MTIQPLEPKRSSHLVYFFAQLRELAERAEEALYHRDGELGGLADQTFTDLELIINNIRAIRVYLGSAEEATVRHLRERDVPLLPEPENGEGPLPRVDPY